MQIQNHKRLKGEKTKDQIKNVKWIKHCLYERLKQIMGHQMLFKLTQTLTFFYFYFIGR